MPNAIISDASCLILLDKIGSLHILRSVYGSIITTNEVAAEFGSKLPDWIQLIDPTDKEHLKTIEKTLDKGEASAIALALEFKDCLLIIDELKGRKYALQLGLNITGTLGVLIEAKLAGDISALKPVLEKIRETNFRLSDHLIETILIKVGE